MAEQSFDRYRLPDGKIIRVDATASKGAPVIDYEVQPDIMLRQRKFVPATLVTGPLTKREISAIYTEALAELLRDADDADMEVKFDRDSALNVLQKHGATFAHAASLHQILLMTADELSRVKRNMRAE